MSTNVALPYGATDSVLCVRCGNMNAPAWPEQKECHHPGQDDGRRRESLRYRAEDAPGTSWRQLSLEEVPMYGPKNENSASVIACSTERQPKIDVLRPASDAIHPQAPAQTVAVAKDRFTPVRIVYDSGIR
jgi:hypothetical protein